MKRTQILIAAFWLAASAAVGAADTGRESTGQYIDDATITSRVKGAFVQDSLVSPLDVKVTTYKGTVQLSGFASSEAEIRRAEALARSVPGVSEVRNDIRIQPAE